MTYVSRALMGLLLGGYALLAHSVPTNVTVMEFYNTGLNHFFRTANPAEAAVVRTGGAGPGWVQTTQNDFLGWSPQDAPANTKPVCRFYASGPNSHFYTADAAECQSLRSLETTQRADALRAGVAFTGWSFEENSFYIKTPTNSACATNEVPVYRLYNNRAAKNDSNHRFTTSLGTYNTFVGIGWIGEWIVMCAPT